VGAVVALNRRTSEVAPEMVEIQSDGSRYAVFAADFEERGEPVTDD
jgi:hypothetical protein